MMECEDGDSRDWRDIQYVIAPRPTEDFNDHAESSNVPRADGIEAVACVLAVRSDTRVERPRIEDVLGSVVVVDCPQQWL